MKVSIHPLLALLESNRNGLKSLLTHYIDATVDSQFASLRNSIEIMIGPQQNYDVTTFGTILPLIQTNSDKPGAESLIEYSNDQLSREQEHQNNLQNKVSLGNTINTNDDVPVIKQEFDHEEEDGEEIDDDSVAKCEKFENGICNSVRDNYDDNLETGENGDEHFETKLNVYAALENNQLRDGDETDLEVNLDEAQVDIDVSDTNDTQMNIQNDVLNNEQLTPSTSRLRSSARKHVQAKIFGDLAQSNVNHANSRKRKSDQANESVKKAKRKQVLDDDEDEDTDSGEYDGQEGHANNAIGEESIATECTTNPIQPNIAQSNRHFQCLLCHKSFDFKFNFQRHLLVHTGKRPFHCDQCDKRFSDKSCLRKHQLIHQNIKNFRCNECTKRFTQKQHLDSHRLTHSGERPFACRHCDKSFTQLNNRNSHEQAIHLHIKPYRCKQCGHTAARQSHTITHIREVHFGLPPTIKQQRAINIIDDRDPRELVEKV